MKEYLQAIVSPLLSEPEALKIVESHDEQGVLLSLNISKKDMGLVIGKGGKTVNAIRDLMHTAGFVNKKFVSVKVNEPQI